MTQHPITHLLVVSEGSDAANRLISSLRNEGLALRAANAGSEPELANLVIHDQWDVLVCFQNARLSLDAVLTLLRKHEQDLPVILVTASGMTIDPLPLFRQGVRDIITGHETNRLLMSVQREAGQYLLRRELRRLDVRYRELEKRHQLILAGSATAVSYVQDGVHLYCNQSYADSFGYDSVETITTTPLLNLIALEDRARLKVLLARVPPEEFAATLAVRKQDGSEATLLLAFTPVEYNGKSCLQLSVRPGDGNADYSTAVARLGTQDLLTRLDNRAHFHNRVENAIRKAVQQGIFSSLLVIVLDEFVDISTAIGRSSANIVLNDIAVFLQKVIRKPYAAARLDEHKFGIILYDGDPDEALALRALIQSKINNRISPAMLTSLELSCSIGMALINGHTLDAGDVLDRAHNNILQAAQPGSGTYQFRVGDSLEHDAGDMLDYLKIALQQQSFRLLYQPLVHIKGEAHQRYEVLTRMIDSDGNDVAPGAFLALANLNGMGESLDRLVVSKALESIRQAGKVHNLIINITSNSLTGRTFLPWLSEQLRTHRMPADMLVLQISEIDIHNSLARSLEFCAGLHELNVQIAISHFGCALEPFAVLQKVQPGFVKLDETMVRDVVYSAQQKGNLQVLIENLHKRALLVVVPQVEDMDVLPILWETGADFVQGYCLQRPSDEMNYEFVQVEEITLSAIQT